MAIFDGVAKENAFRLELHFRLVDLEKSNVELAAARVQTDLSPTHLAGQPLAEGRHGGGDGAVRVQALVDTVARKHVVDVDLIPLDVVRLVGDGSTYHAPSAAPAPTPGPGPGARGSGACGPGAPTSSGDPAPAAGGPGAPASSGGPAPAASHDPDASGPPGAGGDRSPIAARARLGVVTRAGSDRCEVKRAAEDRGTKSH